MRRLVIILFMVLLLALSMAHDTLRLSPVQQISVRYQFNLVIWSAANLPAKWLHWLRTAVSPFHETSAQRLEAVRDYFRLNTEAGTLQGELDRAVATQSTDVSDLERRLAVSRHQLDGLRPQVEETLEAAITDVLREEGIPIGLGKFVFPPVDFALDRPPSVLVISPRDRIERIESIPLAPAIPAQIRDELEERIFGQEDLSALVENTGGISTYPSIIYHGDLRSALITASHEWLHQYLFFRPLGQSYWRDSDMASLNETMANVFADELGNRVFTHLTGEVVPDAPGDVPERCPQDEFCFDQEMRQTRLRVDQLLAEGKVEEAEAYMGQQRQVFVEHGYYIRKLNQAYFAFHGTYADSPASVSPIYGQLQEVRRASLSLGAFVHSIAGVSSYQEFTALLDSLQNGP